MFEDSIVSKHWLRAANLKERALSLGAACENPHDSSVAQRRFTQWRSQVPFPEDDCLRCRLASLGLNEDQFVYILGEPMEALQSRIQAPFLRDIAEAFKDKAPGSDSPALPPSITEQIQAGFVRPFEPLVRLAHQRLRFELTKLGRRYPKPPFDASRIDEIVLSSLVKRFVQILGRTFVLELNVARMEGRLIGETPQERFDSFLEFSSRYDETLRILLEYPVLARQLVTSAQLWLNTTVEFLSNLCADWPSIRTAFSAGRDPGMLLEVSDDAGDSHRGGRSVRIARFDSGFRIVHKPRSLAIDVHFQELLGWLNDHGTQPALPLLIVLDRGDHGWQEFVAPETCTSREAVSRFYARQGAYLALLYALAATDFHSENLIASGENPVLIDLEALFHPRLVEFNQSDAELVAANELYSSVMGTGLLPDRIGGKKPSEGLDLSGMGGAGGQLSPWESPYIEDRGTDRMRLVRKHLTTIECANRPTLNGTPIDLLDYRPALMDGFALTYRVLLANREELLSEQGPLERMRNDEVRVVLRPTRMYGQLLFESYHPDVLRDALDRDRLFDRLWVAAQQSPQLEKIVGQEQEDLWRGDIPIFTTRPGSRDLFHPGGGEVSDFFREPPITGHRLAHLSDADLDRQLWFISASLATVAGAPRRRRTSSTNIANHADPVAHEHLLAASRAVGDRLVSLAFRGEGDASWLGLNYVDEHQPTITPVRMDLYEGLCGIILFLAYLGAITRNGSYSELARAGFRVVERNLNDRDLALTLTSIGGFTGWGGVIYTLSTLAMLWDDHELISKAELIVESLPALIDEDIELDMIGGSAGCICALLALYAVRPSDRTLAVAVRCGEQLLKKSQPMDHGIGWCTIPDSEPLGGVSHGASGFALALFSLFAVTGQQRFRTAALQSIEYERTLFCGEAGNWRDLRRSLLANRDTSARNFYTAWCHGAPGIGFSRLRLLRHLQDDARVHQEIRVALQTTITEGFGGDHSLCHGDAGFLELLLEASQSLHEPRWAEELARLTRTTLESIQRHGWICGVPLGTEVPGLLTGIAGIGYELLRLAEPRRVPSLLSLEPLGYKSASVDAA